MKIGLGIVSLVVLVTAIALWFARVPFTYVDMDKDRPEIIGVPLGGLEGDIHGEPEAHIFTGSKASWYQITDSLPQFESWPGSESRVRDTNA